MPDDYELYILKYRIKRGTGPNEDATVEDKPQKN